MTNTLAPIDNSVTFPDGTPNQIARGVDGAATSALPNKLITLTLATAATLSAEIDMRGYRNVTFHFPAGTPALGTIQSAPVTGGTFVTLASEGTDVTFVIEAKAHSTLKLAGQGFIKVSMDAAYGGGSDTTAYAVLS